MRGLDSNVLLQLPQILKGPFLIGSHYLDVRATLVNVMVDAGIVDDETRVTGTLTAPYPYVPRCGTFHRCTILKSRVSDTRRLEGWCHIPRIRVPWGTR